MSNLFLLLETWETVCDSRAWEWLRSLTPGADLLLWTPAPTATPQLYVPKIILSLSIRLNCLLCFCLWIVFHVIYLLKSKTWLDDRFSTYWISERKFYPSYSERVLFIFLSHLFKNSLQLQFHLRKVYRRQKTGLVLRPVMWNQTHFSSSIEVSYFFLLQKLLWDLK